MLVVSLGLGGAATAQAQLAAKSPFMPAQAGGAAAPESNVPLEFRGYMELGGALQFRLFDPAKKAYAWVNLNERNEALEVIIKRHDRDNETLTVEHRGATHTLAIRTAKVVSGGAVPQAMPPPVPMPAQANVAPAVTQSVVLNPTPADEVNRLNAVASEVARRRALREQATQTVNQQMQGQPPLPLPPPPVPAPTGMQPR